MEDKKINVLNWYQPAAESLLMWSLEVRDLPPEFLMMNRDHEHYHEFQKWLTKYQLALHCISDLPIADCEGLSEIAIEKYISDVYKQDLKRIFAKEVENNES